MTTRHHRSVYIPAPLEKALQEHPEINVSQVCKVALEVATGIIQTPESTPSGELSSTMSNKLSDIEAQLRTHVSSLEKIARLAAVQAGMTILTQEEAETYRGITEGGIKQFILRTKQSAVEEYKQEQVRTRKRKSKSKSLTVPPADSTPGSITPEAPHENRLNQLLPEQRGEVRPTCTDCGDQADVVCKQCGTPLCWTCWTGPDLDAPARETCQKCAEPPA